MLILMPVSCSFIVAVNSYVGCYNLEYKYRISWDVDATSCREKCRTENYSFAGLNSDACYCGKGYRNHNNDSCCDSGTNCHYSWYYSVYRTGKLQSKEMNFHKN